MTDFFQIWCKNDQHSKFTRHETKWPAFWPTLWMTITDLIWRYFRQINQKWQQ